MVRAKLSEVLKGLKDAAPAARPKSAAWPISFATFSRRASRSNSRVSKIKRSRRSFYLEKIDVTLPGRRKHIGGVHPLMQTQDRIIDIFSRLGFALITGPEVETDFANFEALNVPPDHPARDMQDTLYLKQGDLARRRARCRSARC